MTALLPPAVILLAILAWGVDLPYSDQWALVPQLEARDAGELRWIDLWQPHNEHRLFLPRLLMVELAQITGWNIVGELVVNWLLACGILAALLHMVRETLPTRPWWLAPLLSCVVFNPSQWENWSWGWQIQIFLCVSAVVTGIALLVRAEVPWRFAAAVCCGWVATLSFANGLLFWPLALPLVAHPREHRWPRVGLWLVSTVLCFGAYFRGLGGGGDLPSVPALAGYAATYLGAFFINRWTAVAAILGWVALGMLVPLATRLRHTVVERYGATMPWLVLAAFGLASAGLTALGRAQFGVDQALSSRYITISQLFWIGCLGILWVAEWKIPRRITVPSVGLALVLLTLGAAHSAWTWRASSHIRADLRADLLRSIYTVDDTRLVHLWPDPVVVRDHLGRLEHLEMSLYRSPN